MATEAPFSHVDLSSMPLLSSIGIAPAHLHHDLVMDPRMDMAFCSVKSEKQSAMDGSHMLTPRMFEADLALPGDLPPDCTAKQDSINVAVIATPESPPTPPPSHAFDHAKQTDQVDPKKKDRPVHRGARKKCGSNSSTCKRTTPNTSRSSNKPSSVGMGDDRRNRCLERNRIAASKCREKKKAWVAALEDKKTALQGRHSALRREHADLVAECARIKTTLMEHANCHDGNINAWLEHEAVKFVKRRTTAPLAPGAADCDDPKDSLPADSDAPPGAEPFALDRNSSIGSVLSMSCNDSRPSLTDESAVLLSSPDMDAMDYDFMPDEMFPDTS
ncbi:hypothetical protein CDD82_3902 [Ophiocordyceps australis]|uniref:BZIP domain-containing protein n=1 Tax=Ophiocordyceps australis TaxID=1399860 RepID=A0A2C5XM69_9HYPO|nr:hypothetical protein CDD82_3902 [Ophiocordyceps australis]